MTHELILTSVSQGLNQDEQGFCAVAADKGISGQVYRRLLTLSDYRHLFPPGGESGTNPTVYSHLIFPAVDATWHVLSRIADTGKDFKHEPNHLAHHVVLGLDELTPEGPAWLLGLPGFHFVEWNTPSVRFDRGRPIPTLTSPPSMTRRQRIARERHWLDLKKICPEECVGGGSSAGIGGEAYEEYAEMLQTLYRENDEQIAMSKPPSSPCPLWKEATGDAGWGGVLAETIRTGQPVLIVYRPGMNLLPLFIESLALLSPEMFWRATFTTCYTRLPEHVSCQWKGVPVGSPEAKSLRQDYDQLVIDLTETLGPAPLKPYVEYARYGIENMIPEDESEPGLFENQEVGMDTNPFIFEQKETKKTDGDVATAAETVDEDQAADGHLEPALVSLNTESIVPPIITQESIRIRPRQQSSHVGPLAAFLNMKSRGQFYLLYGVTLTVVLILLVLVLDQIVDLGIARSLKEKKPKPQVVQSDSKMDSKTKSDAKSGSKSGSTQDSDVVTDSVAANENIRQQRTEREQARVAEKRRKEHEQRLREVHEKMERDKVRAAEKLSDYLLDATLPKYLDFRFPFSDGRVADEIPPGPVFAELADLYENAPALRLEFFPLLQIPLLKVETRQLSFFLDDNHLADTPTENALDENVPVEQTPEYRLNGEGDENTQEKIPDTERFEWSVLAVDTKTGDETPMFHLKLTRDGLQINWVRDGLAAQHFRETILASLGFLRVSVDGESNRSKTQSIPLFKPRDDKAIYPAVLWPNPLKEDFNPQYSVKMPFAEEPWKEIFEATTVPFSLKLVVTITPDIVSGVEKVETPQPESPSRFVAEFHTEIGARRPTGTQRDTYSPVTILFEAAVDPLRLLWTDRFTDQLRETGERLTETKKEEEKLTKEQEEVQNRIFARTDPDLSSLRKRRNELKPEIETVKRNLTELENIVQNLPSAREKVFQNENLRFDYAVYLVAPDDDKNDEDEEMGDGRLRNEEQILVLQSDGTPKNEVQQDEP